MRRWRLFRISYLDDFQFALNLCVGDKIYGFHQCGFIERIETRRLVGVFDILALKNAIPIEDLGDDEIDWTFP